MAFFDDLQPVTIASAFVVGMALALLNTLRIPLGQRLALSETGIGWLLSTRYLVLIPMMILSGILIDRNGPRGVLFAGSLLTAGAVFTLALGRTYVSTLTAILFLGVGAACLSTGSIVLMPRAFFVGKPVAASLNLGNVFYALGALVTPAVAEWLIRRLELRRGVGILALLCLVPALATSLTPTAAFDFGGNPDDLDVSAVLAHPVLWLAGLVFLLYIPLENSLGNWGTTYLMHLGATEQRAERLLAGFWLTFVVGRLVTALVQQDRWWHSAFEPWLMLGLALTAAVCLGNLAGSEKLRPVALGWLLLGLSLGPIFPTLVAILFEFFPVREHGTAYGAMFSIGSIGGLILPPMLTSWVRRTTPRRAMILPMGVALLLALATLTLGVIRNAQR